MVSGVVLCDSLCCACMLLVCCQPPCVRRAMPLVSAHAPTGGFDSSVCLLHASVLVPSQQQRADPHVLPIRGPRTLYALVSRIGLAGVVRVMQFDCKQINNQRPRSACLPPRPATHSPPKATTGR
jgi:hypothetical protein